MKFSLSGKGFHDFSSESMYCKLILYLLVLLCPGFLIEFSGHPLQLGGDTFPLKLGRTRTISKISKNTNIQILLTSE